MSSKGMVSVAVVFITLGAALFLATPAAQATVLYWDRTTGGYWDTSSYWATNTSGGSLQGWTAGDDADFYTAASSGTVSISNTVSVGNITFGAAGYIVAGGTLSVSGTVTSNYNATIDSVIAGSSLTTAGAGTLILGGSNTYTGATTITAGTLQLGDGSALTGSVAGSISDSSMLTFANPAAESYAGVISGSGSVTINSANVLTILNNNSYTGGTTLANGTLQFSNSYYTSPIGTGPFTITGGTISATGGVYTLHSTQTWYLNGNFAVGGTLGIATSSAAALTLGGSNYTVNDFDSGNFTIAGAIGDGGHGWGFTKSGSGQMVLSGTNTYTGTTTISGGTLDLTGSGNAANLASPIVDNAALTFGSNSAVTYSGNISGSGSVLKTSTPASVTVLSGSNSFSGGITNAGTPSGGTLQVGSTLALGSTNGAVTITSGILDLHNYNPTIGSLSGAGTVENLLASTTSTLTIGGTGNGAFTGKILNGSGIVAVVKSGTGALTLSGSNLYGGGTTLSNGTLNINAVSAVGTGALTITGGTLGNTSGGSLALGTNNTQNWDGDFAFAGSNDLSLGNGAVSMSSSRTVTVASNTLTVSGAISGPTYSLTKSGAGTLVLAGGNLYTGGTTISGGTLQVGNSSALGVNRAVTVSSGVLDLHGFNVNVSTLSGAATIDNVAATTTSTLTVGTGNASSTFSGAIKNTTGVIALTKNGTGVLQLDGNNTYTGATSIQGVLSGNGTLASTVTVNSAAYLAPGDNTSGNFSGAGTLTLGGLTLNTGSIVDLDLGTSSDLAKVTGTLTLTGGTVNVTAGSGFGVGNYEIMSYSGFSGNVSNLTVGTLPGGYSAVLVNTGSQINLDVTGAALTWTGSQNSSWDTTSVNWSTGGGTATYADPSPVVFNDSAGTANGTVVLSGTTFSPTTITVNNSTVSYTLSGDGTIGGSTSLTKSGGGTLIIAMPNNTYSGSTNLTAGVLQIAADSTLSGGSLTSGPLGTGTLILSGGTLEDDGSGRTLVNPISVTGNVTLASGGAGGLTLSGNTLAITGSPTITVAAPTTIGDQITGGSLVLAGASTLTLTAATNTYTGPTLVEGGSLVGNVANIPTAVTLSNNANVTFNQTSAGTLNVGVSGTGSLTQIGGSVLTLGPSLSYSGNTTVGSGTLQLGSGVLPTVAHLPLDGTLGAVPTTTGAILDTSGHGYNGTITAAGANYVTGQINQGMQLNGQYVDVPANSGFNTLTAWTDSIWMNLSQSGDPNTNGGSWCFVNGRGLDTGPGGFYEVYNGSVIKTGIQNASQQWINEGGQSITCSITANSWHMVTFAVSSAGWYFYIDGGLNGSASGTLGGNPVFSPGGNDMYVGGRPSTNNWYNSTVASIDDFQLYGSVLTAAQVQQLYYNGAIQNGLLPSNTPVQLANGTMLDLDGQNQTIDSLADSGPGSGGTVTTSIAGASGTATLTLAPAGTAAFSGSIQDGDPVALTMNGPGKQILSGVSDYSGGTTIAGGTLQVGNSSALGSSSGAATVSAGVLDLHSYNVGVGALSGTGTIDNLAGASTSTLTAGNGDASSTFSGVIQNTTGVVALAKTGGGILVLDGTSTYTGGTTVSSGTLDFATPAATPSTGIITVPQGGYVALGALSGASSPVTEADTTDATETVANTSGASGTVATTSTVSETAATVGGSAAWLTGGAGIAAGAAAVPEPSTFILLGVGVLGLLACAWRRRRPA